MLLSKGTIGGILVAVIYGGLFLPGMARAEGFRCLSGEADVAIDIFHETQPRRGTRNVATLLVKDPEAPRGERTLLRFFRNRGHLSNESAYYEAEVTPDAIVSSNGQRILGIRLSGLEQVQVGVQFTYGMPLPKGESTSGFLTLVARSGEKQDRRLVCTRYLKH